VLKEIWAKVDVLRQSRLALVLDVSESAQARWPSILRLALDTLERVPETCQCSIYFLGDTRSYSKDELRRDGASLYREHRGRASVISPLLDGLAEGQDTAYIVLCEGRIYDLEDWVDTPFAERLVLANFGEHPVAEGTLSECDASVEQIFESAPLRARLGTPIRLEISGKAVMPFQWDNAAFTFNNGKLMAEGTNNWGVMFGVLCLSQEDIQATVVMQGNILRDADLTICPSALEEVWETAIPRDAARLRQVIQYGVYDCDLGPRPHQHSAGSLRYPCDEERLLGRYIYSFLKRLNGSGFVLVRDNGESVRYSQHLRQALRLGDDTVAVRSEGMTDVYQFRRDSSVWQPARRTFNQYQLVTGETYAIAI
jgi:hypothetical protein